MKYYTSTASTASSYSYSTDISYDISRPVSDVKKKAKDVKFRSKLLEAMVQAGILSNYISVFADRRSFVFKDMNVLNSNYGIRTYYNDPVTPGYDAQTPLHSYNYSLIIDALEYMPNIMDRANLIKEALVTLSTNNTHRSYVLILTKTRKMVQRLAKKRKYEPNGDSFLIPSENKDELFSGATIQGLDVSDIEGAAFFAGAKLIDTTQIVKIDEALVRVYT